MMYVGLIPYSIASAIVVPTMTALVSNMGGISEKGTILGIFRSIGALARAFGPLAASAGELFLHSVSFTFFFFFFFFYY